ncbi:putative serine/threonine-protein kinase [Lachnellula subtilissima]|uniref:non-specific serine/threonine protein kinase n=1 Tax=Lachnellula subtilissima TaxID=602034 RepID=A0A8H8RSR6_9HELO|nr:putative serine/threonine-protein kinase [Lachnellula subtilissima]
MSLVPYSSRDSREVVLRHNDAIVIRDPQTQQLILRGATPSPSFSDCPTCHRPFRSSSPERQSSPHRIPEPFISPEYFRMLQAANGRTDEYNPPSSPIRRLVEPGAASPSSSVGGSVSNAEFVTSTPDPNTGHSIKKEAFSPNYFKTFFTEEKELGRGGKGVVLLVKHELDGVSLGQFACKRVPVGDDHAWLEKVLIEVQLLQGLSHPNLVSYRHVWLEDVKLNRFGPSVPCAFILQQYCNSGDLLHYIAGSAPSVVSTKEQFKAQRRVSRGQAETMGDARPQQRKLSFEEIYSFFKDITSGLAHLHSSNYIHRDLKPSNCLLHQDGNEIRCLISDFGEVQPENVVRKSTGSTGTISYCAPEVLKRDHLDRYGNFTTKSDIFSLGMILYFMCFGRLPYKSADSILEEFEDIDTLRAEISSWKGFQDERRERPELPNQLYNFLKRLLAINPAERPSASDILHAIRTEKGLENPRKRPSSASGLGGRIRNIDSPMPPSTPVHDPSKRDRSGAYLEDAPSSEEASPESSLGTQLASESDHAQASLEIQTNGSSLEPKIATPLLMPPHYSRMSTFNHQLSLYQHYVVSWASLNQQTLYMLLKIGIFGTKVFSLTKPCLPVMPRETLWWPLLGIAALDLALGNKIRWRVMGLLAMVHVITLFIAVRFGRGLCSERGFERWELVDN